jgi:raffinose synthase
LSTPGYWKGLDKDSFAAYNLEETLYAIPEKFKQTAPDAPNAATVGNNFYPANNENLPFHMNTHRLRDIYDDYYRFMAACGADGTKIDAISWLEALGYTAGGRLKLMRDFVRAAENASGYVGGQMLACSSHSNDFLFNSGDFTVMRTSCDYFPQRSETHGKHILNNLYSALFLHHIFIPDWDMFQSGNTAGEFHAMSKAISGGPVYVTDEPGKERFDIIKRLCTAEGRVPRCVQPLRVCEDSVFNGFSQNWLVKGFAKTEHGFVLGIFNCGKDGGGRVRETMRLALHPGLGQERYAVYSYRRGFLGCGGKTFSFEEDLDVYEADIITAVPVVNGVAVIGDTGKYNCSAFIANLHRGEASVEVEMYEDTGITVFYETGGIAHKRGERIKLDYQ